MMKRSLNPQTPAMRRSSSADNFGSSSQNRQSAGRSSSIGRPSSIGFIKTADGKPIEAKDLAPAIFDELEVLGYPIGDQFTVKTLLLPSTATFYSIFEFLIKTIGIQDVWNPNYLMIGQPKNQNQITSSQPQPNAVQQNKNRIDLVIHHLTFLKFSNIPKANILQNMTTPKHWTLMLQILYFLCNNCKFLTIYDPESVINTMAANQDFINHYISKVYKNVVKIGYEYLQTEEYLQNKKDSLAKFETLLRGNMDYDKIKANLADLNKTYEYWFSQRDEFDVLLKEEEDLKRQLEEEEDAINKEMQEYEDRVKRNGLLKSECANLKEKVIQMEREVAAKDAQYERQLASGKNLGNLPTKHAQTLKELENLQNQVAELDNEKDELYIQLNQKSIDAKNAMNKANEMLKNIKIATNIPVDEIPSLEMTDLHKKNNINEYMDLIIRIRKEYNEKILELPSQLSNLTGERKMIESKIESYKSTLKNLEQEIANFESLLSELKISTDGVIYDFIHQVSEKKNDLVVAKKQNELEKEKLVETNNQLKKVLEEEKKLKSEAVQNQNKMLENIENVKRDGLASYETKKKQVKDEFEKYQADINGYINSVKEYLKTRPNNVDI
ncbi:unnamed protein product [Brachionus calyciflorus]|uniref:Kinetochore protein NDC80 n=1 Tax=Brachionus calyciflorus TaxID=104777 RepID=A0A813R377_9BILA|nr:unnamed protein product [Brachionus calyciflorus]